MQQDANFSVRYLTEERVPIRDVIESLHGIEALMAEVKAVLPSVVEGLQFERLDVKIREIAQESPLREMFLLTLVVAYQDQLKSSVVDGIHDVTGYSVPHNLEALVTVLAMVLVFFGVGAIKDLVTGGDDDGPSKRMLDGLLEELALQTGMPAAQIRKRLDTRYGDKVLWRKIANATSRFFTPSKQQDSAAVEVNGRLISQEIVRDIPAQYLIDHEADSRPARSFSNVTLELHAQDRDHAGRGWAAIPKGITEQRLRLRLMEDVGTSELWNRNIVHGDITIIYDRVGSDITPKEIHLHRVTGAEG